MTLAAVVRAFAGEDWHPAEMAFTSRLPVSAAAREQFPHTRYVLGQKSSWITMPRAMLIDVASALGWSSPSTFTRSFSEIAGISPSDYRARAKVQG